MKITIDEDACKKVKLSLPEVLMITLVKTGANIETLLKQMKETFTDEEEGDATMSQYKNLYMDQAIEMVADEIVDQVGENFTQQLYEQMKRNYNIE